MTSQKRRKKKKTPKKLIYYRARDGAGRYKGNT